MIQALIQLAYKFWPELYKKRFFKKLNSLHTNNFQCEPELLYLHQVLKNDSVFIDIGTNKGIYLYQAEKVIKTGKIIGFEPNPQMWKFAKHLFPKAQLINLAASSQSGSTTLYIPKTDKGLQDTRASLEDLGENVEKVEIKAITLDLWTEKAGVPKIDLIKIDVEGHEFDSIKGCENILKTIKPIFIIEIELRHAKYPIHEIFDFIKSFGYEVFYFDRQLLKPLPFNVSDIASYQKDEYLNNFNAYINNFIFIPKI